MNPEAIEKLIEKGRDSYESRLAAGQARLKNGDLEPAIEHFRKATEFNPQHTTAWQELGRALKADDELPAAREAWKNGLSAARANGDKQAEKVLQVWLKRLDKTDPA
ncbi:MAG: tetratricopeptide repeat protein [Wenzhouxiangellaceae bacterium]|nr:tetratricopeptide repeat protein [Wenzhouxiangellaceae bacterium]